VELNNVNIQNCSAC